MSKYLFYGSYTEKGLNGLLEEGGSKRRGVSEQLFRSLGGKLEAYYFAFGDNDFYIIADLPDNVSSAAGSLVVNASGAIKVKTVVLLTPEEVDAAVNQSVEFSAPGK
ncbi:MAG TPA: GYD domain-containing protein [candidate division Zixibacteria bacterium]|nr:GYD domain-containing protein [candidate division Zixibacteria bacterium]